MFIEKVFGIPQNIVSYKKPKHDRSTVSILFRTFKNTVDLLRYFYYKNDKNKINPQLLYKFNKSLCKKYLYGTIGGLYHYQHASLWEIVNYKLIDRSVLDKSIILAVHRNPVDRLISIYKYWGFHEKMDFEEFCEKYVKNRKNALNNFGFLMHLKTQWSFVSGVPPYTERVEWIKFENLDKELKDFIRRHGLDISIPNDRVNTSEHIQVTITGKAKEIIYEEYKEDFVNFGYEI